MTLTTEETIDFVAIGDPAVDWEAMTEEQIAAYQAEPDVSKLPLLNDAKPIIWQLRGLLPAEMARAYQSSFDSEAGEINPSDFYYHLSAVGVVAVRNLPPSVPTPPFETRGGGLWKRISLSWIRSLNPATATSVGNAVATLSTRDQEQEKNWCWSSAKKG